MILACTNTIRFFLSNYVYSCQKKGNCYSIMIGAQTNESLQTNITGALNIPYNLTLGHDFSVCLNRCHWLLSLGLVL